MSAHEPQPDTLLDVIIVGAGLSGIGAAVRLKQQCPDKSFTILEARDAIGGTWDLFRYPGIRSDSDMYTLSYDFKPWTNDKAIADGPDIRAYINETADQYHVRDHIRLGHRVIKADWSSEQACWTLEVAHTDSAGNAQHSTLRGRFLYLCSGYYSYEEAYRPDFPQEESFKGRIVHPQFWPEDLDYRNQRVVVIGSGATAITLIPAMAKEAAHVTMLQRSPTYVVNRPLRDKMALTMQRFMPAGVAHSLTRWKHILLGIFYFRLAKRRPAMFKKRLIQMASDELGPDVDTRHFTPDYNPWDQRICVAPDGDLFKDIRQGRASVVTDHIERFTADGVQLKSGNTLPADLIVVATGLKLNMLGDIQVQVDGKAVNPADTMAYKGMMLSGVPNCAMAFGYVNSSWTLKADLTADYVCRLLRHMDANQLAVAIPERDPDVAEEPFLSFTSGYVQRASRVLPKQGDRVPWQVYQNYLQDRKVMRKSPIDDGVLRFYPVPDKAAHKAAAVGESA
ncbi:flavin-containing monooxygenase [Halopseudomonas salegens]|uniref:Cyclohexanone monooxygenase n=1 Tax=Halopseudomonas salegens TaxID=1434072 RepID=A0A1H2E1F1_9GAMM|nr:NAD(P)/FAD-dependent oxidoreductase [Halopseudomonas salegens]SDT88885.1 cyclohexanone monooxygenase [Halopseudomonas salegens]